MHGCRKIHLKTGSGFPIVSAIFNQFDLILAQDNYSCVRYEMLGRRITSAGNLKYDTPLPHNAAELQKSDKL